jgi:hypothetical protein
MFSVCYYSFSNRFFTLEIKTATSLAIISSLSGTSSLFNLLRIKGDKEDKAWALNLWYNASNQVDRIRCSYFLWRRLPSPFEQKLQYLKEKCKTQQKIWSKRIATRNYYAVLRRNRITFPDAQRLLLTLGKSISGGGDYDAKGVLPGTLDEAEAFLNVKLGEDNEDNNDEPLQLESPLEELASELVAGLQEFPIGQRVTVANFNDADYNPNSNENVSIDTLSLESNIGIIVSSVSGSGVVQILFDDNPTPEFVPREAVQKLDLVYTDQHNNDKVSVEGMHQKCGTVNGKKKLDSADLAEKVKESPKKNNKRMLVDTVEEDESSEVEGIFNDNLPPGGQKCRTIEDALREGGWEFIRSKKHIRYRRRVKSGSRTKHQHFTMAKTPSDFRAMRNALATLNRLNSESTGIQDEVKDGHFQCVNCLRSLPELCFSKNQLKKHWANIHEGKHGCTCKACIKDVMQQ